MVSRYLRHLLPMPPEETTDYAEDHEEFADALDAIIRVFPELTELGSSERKSARLKATARRKRGEVRPVMSTEPGPPEGDPSKDKRPETAQALNDPSCVDARPVVVRRPTPP